jgi:hypothetical protein
MQPTNLSPLDLARQVDALCDRFEAEWRAGRRPRLEDFLAPLPGSLRAPFLRGLLAVEIELRGARGESACPDEYRARFPDQAGAIGEAFGVAAETSVCRVTVQGNGP